MVYMKPGGENRRRQPATTLSLALPAKSWAKKILLQLVLLLLDLLGTRVVILITISGAATTVSSVSIAGALINTPPAPALIASTSSSEALLKPLQNPPPNSMLTVVDAPSYKHQDSPRRLRGSNLSDYLKKSNIPTSEQLAVVKRSRGDTRVSSNQDVTTLALAVDNSSSVAIANINSSWNNVFVSIANPLITPFSYHHPYRQSD